jgi:hypothetical protein
MAGSVYQEGPGLGSVYYQPREEEEEDEEKDEFLEAWEEEAEEEEEADAFADVAAERRVFALGLVLREFAVEGASADEREDEEGEEEEGEQQSPPGSGVAAALVRKRATATALAVYCDSLCQPLVVYQTHAHPAALLGGGASPSPMSPAGPSQQQQQRQQQQQQQRQPSPPQEEHSYLLQPTSGELSLTTRPVPLSPTKPQHDVACRLARVHVAVTRPQVDRLATIAAAFSAFSQWDPEQQRLWRLRPRRSAVEEPRAWWRYAKEVRGGRGVCWSSVGW